MRPLVSADPIIAEQGGASPFLTGPYPSVSDIVARWVARDGCAGEPRTTFQQGDGASSPRIPGPEGPGVFLGFREQPGVDEARPPCGRTSFRAGQAPPHG